MNDKLTLKNGTAIMDKCLNAALTEQRTMAHEAIDMEDWSKGQEKLAVAKRNITLVEDLRVKFEEYKNSVRAAEEIIRGGEDVSEQNEGSIPIDPVEDIPEPPQKKSRAKAAPEEEQAGDELLVRLEELIVEFPFTMAVCNEVAGIGDNFTYDNAETESMKKPAKLSNGLWVDTAISKSKAEELVKALREYGEKSS